MIDEQPETTIQVFREGTRYFATLNAETPHGPLTRLGRYTGRAISPCSAIDKVLAMVQQTADHRKRGPKPKAYRKCRYLVYGEKR
jgi:hypothetical protein